MSVSSPTIILIEPQLSENVGMAARAMMNCGLSQMRLVNPRENHLSEKGIAASSGADIILREAQIYSSTTEAISDLNLVFATTARHRDQIKFVHTANKAAEIMTKETQNGNSCGIIFGPERTGLHNDDIALSDSIIEIPLNPQHCSLNLSQAVLLVGYEWYKLQISAPDSRLVTNGAAIASKDKLLTFFDFLENELSHNPFFNSDEKRPRLIRNLHNIFLRSNLTEQELNTLYGIINYLSHKKDPTH